MQLWPEVGEETTPDRSRLATPPPISLDWKQ